MFVNFKSTENRRFRLAGSFAVRALGERKSARTRAHLMDAAAEAFATTGIEAASINAIAHGADEH